MKRFTWFLAWLRGTSGLLLLVLAGFIFFIAADLASFDELLEEKPVASISFEKIAEQHYKANVTFYIDKDPESFEIYGDQWQMDARIVRWTGVLSAIGAKPGIKLDRISGRYYSLEQERLKPRSVYSLADGEMLDMWSVLQSYSKYIPGIDATYGSAAYLPMADQAAFQLSLSHNGLTAEPTNNIAKEAVSLWR